MTFKFQNLLIKTLLWLLVEIILNWVGLDNVADYSEFIFTDREIQQVNVHPVATFVLSSRF